MTARQDPLRIRLERIIIEMQAMRDHHVSQGRAFTDRLCELEDEAEATGRDDLADLRRKADDIYGDLTNCEITVTLTGT